MENNDSPTTAKYCHCINGRQVCTINEHLSKIYRDIERITKYDDDAATPWEFILAVLPFHLKEFAQSRGIEEDDTLMFNITKQFNLATEIYKIDDQDKETVRGILANCIDDLQYADQHLNPEKDTQNQQSDTEKYPPIELKITIKHRTQDMTIAGSYEDILIINFSDLHEGKSITTQELQFVELKVLEVAEDHILLSWGNSTYTLNLGETHTTGYYMVDNPYLSVDMVCLTFEYRKIQ